MNNSVTIAYSFELHFTTTSLDGLKPGNIDKQQATVTSKKIVSISAADNIIPEQNVALELGKSTSLAAAEEEEAGRHVHATNERLMMESDPEPARRSTRRRPSGIAFRDTSSVSKKKSPDQSQKLKGIQTLTAKEQLAADMMQALKASKKISRSQPHARGLSEGTGVSPGVPDESTLVLITLKEESKYYEEENVEEEIKLLTTNEDEEKKDDDEDNRSIDIEQTDDDEETADEFVHGDEYVHDNVNEEIKDAEVAKTGKDDEEITNAEKTDAEKTKVTKGDLEQTGKLPLTSSSLSVSSGFGNQFLNFSSNTSLIGTTKESADTKINSLLDIQIQQEPTVLSSKPEIPIVISATTLTPHPSVTNLTPVLQQQTKPIPTPPITTVAPAATTVPAAIDEYLGSNLGDALQMVLQKYTKELIQQSSQKDVSEIIKIKQEQATKEKMPKFLATPYDQAVEVEFKQKDILFKMMRESKSYKKHLKHKALYDKLILSLIQDEDDLDRVPSKTSSASKETSKGDTPPKSSKTGKSKFVEESVKEATYEVIMGKEEPVQENVNDADQLDGEAAPKNNWFKQPPRTPTSDPEWNSCQVVDDQPEQPWFNNLLSAQKDPIIFDKLMSTPIDYFKFAMNHLKTDMLTKSHLVGPVYNLLKGTCQSSIKLEYNMKECYKALSDQLDWNNPKGDRCPFDLSKPLPLKGHPSHLIVALEYFYNNDLEYLKSSDPEKKYTTSITKIKAARYELVAQLNRFSNHDVFSPLKILSVVSVKVDKLHGYGYLEEIMDMLLLVVQHTLFHLDGEVIVDLAVALRMFTRSLIIKKRDKDVQLGVEIYQKKLNITKPQKDFLGISAKELCTPSFEPPGVFYKDLSHRKRLMRADELYKFSDGMLKKVRDTLHHRLLNF
ncbi:hypothetical protein Tco_0551533 [Tanacetum coccineum]